MGTAANQKRWINSSAGIAYRKSDAFRESIRKYNRNNRDRRYRDTTVRKLREIKLESGCVQCGFRSHHAALEFHHRNPEIKKFRLGESRNYSWKAVLLEVEKCDILCANCHAVLEHDKRTQPSAALPSVASVKVAQQALNLTSESASLSRPTNFLEC